MSITPFQPTLPAEVLFTDAELNYIEESPPGLYPENQDSNYGLLRKLFTDHIQELIEQQITMYNERFVATSTDFLDEWEKQVGLPVNPSSRTLIQRRQDVLSRLARGPFTRSRIAKIVENYITPTFGDPIQLTPSGVPLSAGGVPLYSETVALPSSYRIYEDSQNFAYAVWIVSSVTPDPVALLRELKRITPSSITVTLDNAHANILDYNQTVRNLNPIGYWRLGTLNDSSGYGNTGTAVGGVTAGSLTSPGLLHASIGGTDAATDFDGTNDAITAPFEVGSTVKRFTIAVWVKADTLPGAAASKGIITDNANKTQVMIYDTGKIRFIATVDGVAKTLTTSTNLISAATTYFITVTFDGQQLEIFLNGVPVGTLAAVGDASITNTGGNIAIGELAAASYFDGKIDDLQIYRGALTDAEILRLYNTGINVA